MNHVKRYFEQLQAAICSALVAADGRAVFSTEEFLPGRGISRPRVMEQGERLEKAAVNFSHSVGDALPEAASVRNPHLAGRPFEAAAISMIVHPWNPYVPTFHANLRFFVVDHDNWHFGGGFDLTPYYPFAEDVLHWHSQAAAACAPFGDGLYARLKQWCDQYFYLTHRQEPRGVGGLFFDDWTEGGFDQAFEFVQSVGDHIMPAYLPILERRAETAFGQEQEQFMLYRRGRYAEFNLAIDRGTQYGLQSGRRIESVLASMPPRASWKYNWHPEPGSPEAVLYTDYLRRRDWLSELK